MRRLSPTVERIVAAVALTTAFVVMASVFAPDLSHANTDRGSGPQVSAYEDHAPASPALGTIEDDAYLVEVFAGPAGPRYTVKSREDGSELGIMMTAEEVAEWFPELPLPSMDFGAGSALMLAEPFEAPSFD